MIKKLSAIALSLSCLFNGVTVNASVIYEDDHTDTTTGVDEVKGDSTVNANEESPAEAKEPATGVLTVIALDADGNSLTGVDYSVMDAESNLAAMWTTTGSEYSVSLEEGEYTLIERSVPDGYTKHDNLAFEIVEGNTTAITRKYYVSGSTFIDETLNEGVIEVSQTVSDVEEENTTATENAVVSKGTNTVTEKIPVLSKNPVLMKTPSLLGAANDGLYDITVSLTALDGTIVYDGMANFNASEDWSDKTITIEKNGASAGTMTQTGSYGGIYYGTNPDLYIQSGDTYVFRDVPEGFKFTYRIDPKGYEDTSNFNATRYDVTVDSDSSFAFIEQRPLTSTTLATGSNFNAALKKLSGQSTATYSTSNTSITSILRSTEAPDEGVTTADISADQDGSIVAWYDNGTIYWYTADDIIYMNADSAHMFEKMTNIGSVDLSDLNSSNVTSLVDIFSTCTNLTSVDLSSFETPLLTNMQGMFYNCKNIESVDLSMFDTSNVTNMQGVFQNASKLRSVDVSSFDTSNVTNMQLLFDGCSLLTSVDLSSFNTASVTNMQNAFRNCSSMGSIKLGAGFSFKTNANLPTPSSAYPFVGKWELQGNTDASKQYTASQMMSNNPQTAEPGVYVWAKDSSLPAGATVFDSGNNFNKKIKTLAGNSNPTYDTSNTTITSFQRSLTAPSVGVTTADLSAIGDGSILGWFDNGTIYWYSENSTVLLNKDCQQMFMNLTKATNISFDGIDVSIADNMLSMFESCKSLPTINLPAGFAQNATNIRKMFKLCENITSLTLPAGFGQNTTTLNATFSRCRRLSSLTVPQGFGQNATIATYMFDYCTTLRTLDLSGFDASKITDMGYMFDNTNKISTLKLNSTIGGNDGSRFSNSGLSDTLKFVHTEYADGTPTGDTTEYTGSQMKAKSASDLAGLWEYDSFDTLTSGTSFNAALKRLSGQTNPNYNTANTTITGFVRSNTAPGAGVSIEDISADQTESIVAWYDNGTIYWYTDVDIVYMNADSSHMFNNLQGLVNLDLSDLDSSNVTNMSYIFNNCYALTSLDVSHFNTSAVTNMSYMFYKCSSLTSLDLSDFNTSNVTNMSYMFCYCNALTSLDLSNFNTLSVTNMSTMFRDCSGLKSLDLSNFDTSAVTNMQNMLYNCSRISQLKLSDKMGGTDGTKFANTSLPAAVEMNHISTSDGTPTGDSTLYTGTQIKALSEAQLGGLWRKDSTTLTTGQNFSTALKQLSGDSNPTYNSNNSSITSIVRSDTAPASGITTADISAAGDESIVAWYDNGTIYWYSPMNTVYMNANCQSMFDHMCGLTSVDVSQWNSSKVTNMQYMFSHCTALTDLDLSNFNTSKVTNMYSMFANCTALKTLDISNFDTVTPNTNTNYMFGNCSNLQTLKLSDNMTWNYGPSISNNISFKHVSDSAGDPTGDDALYTGGQISSMTADLLGGTWECPEYVVSYDVTRRGIGTVPDQTRHAVTTDIITISSVIPRGRGSAVMNEVYFIGDYDEVDYESASYGSSTTVTFRDWLGDDGNTYVGGDTYSANADLALTAQYDTNTTYYQVTLPNATKEGYILDGWYTPGGIYVGTAGDVIMPDGRYDKLTAQFSAASKTMTLTNTVDGNLGSKDKEFTYYAAFDDGTNAVIDISGIEYWKNGVQQTVTTDEGDIVITMAHGDTVELRNVPAGAYWTIAQQNYSSEGYSTSYRIGSGESVDGTVATGELTDDTSVSFSNVRSTTVPTEIRTDTPIVGLCVAGLAVILLGLYIARKRLVTGD